MGSDASGAVRSSWMWKRLICVFLVGIARPPGVRGGSARSPGTPPLGVDAPPLLTLSKYRQRRPPPTGGPRPPPPIRGALVRGQDRDDDQQQAERERPHGDAVGPGAEALVGAGRRPAARAVAVGPG